MSTASIENGYRCQCCLEDCADAEVIRMPRDSYCVLCRPSLLCERCRVQMPDRLSYCMYCVVPERDSREDETAYHERVDAILGLMEPAQRRRWVSVDAMADRLDTLDQELWQGGV